MTRTRIKFDEGPKLRAGPSSPRTTNRKRAANRSGIDEILSAIGVMLAVLVGIGLVFALVAGFGIYFWFAAFCGPSLDHCMC